MKTSKQQREAILMRGSFTQRAGILGEKFFFVETRKKKKHEERERRDWRNITLAHLKLLHARVFRDEVSELQKVKEIL